MTREVSTKNYVLVLMDRSKFFLDKNEAEYVKRELMKGTKYLEIGDSLIVSSTIMKIIGGGDYEEQERYKRGDYKCSDCNQWIPKGKSCGYCG